MAKPNKNDSVQVVVNKRPCESCSRHTSGIIHGYEWRDCTKNWSDKSHGLFYGVIKNTCDNYQSVKN